MERVKSFLIIDDDITMCQLVTFYLSPYALCFSAQHASKALELFKSRLRAEPFSAVFMDIEMPGFKGHDLAELFRDAEEKYHIPPEMRFKLVMVSAHDDIVNVSTSFHKNKASCFITKPFSEASLLRELRAAFVL